MREMIRTHTYCHDWDTVTSAFWLKYPNESQPHVQEIHTVERSIDEETKIMKLTRLVCIDYALPGWIERLINFRLKGHAVENIDIDLDNRKLTLKGRNLSFWNCFKVEEECVYEAHPENKEWTLFTQTQRYTVSGFDRVNEYLENYCITKGKDAAGKGLGVMNSRISRIQGEWEDRLDSWGGELKGIYKNAITRVEAELQDIEHSIEHKVDELKDEFKQFKFKDMRVKTMQTLREEKRQLEQKLHNLTHKKSASAAIAIESCISDTIDTNKQLAESAMNGIGRIRERMFGPAFWRNHFRNPFTHAN